MPSKPRTLTVEEQLVYGVSPDPTLTSQKLAECLVFIEEMKEELQRKNERIRELDAELSRLRGEKETQQHD